MSDKRGVVMVKAGSHAAEANPEKEEVKGGHWSRPQRRRRALRCGIG